MAKLPDTSCVVKVGDGRGFIIEHRYKLPRMGSRKAEFATERLVVTAAHCLPNLPPVVLSSDRTYENLLGRVGGTQNVWAACVFVDPVADIAVLGCPDCLDKGEPSDKEAYWKLTDNAEALRISTARNGFGWILSLDKSPRWIRTKKDVFIGWRTTLSIDPTKPDMSGSPILDSSGCAVGVISIRQDCEDEAAEPSRGQPLLTLNLPGWLLE